MPGWRKISTWSVVAAACFGLTADTMASQDAAVPSRADEFQFSPQAALAVAFILLAICVVALIVSRVVILRLRRESAAAKEDALAKSLFIASMSHELRTPVNAVLGFAELAMDAGTSRDSREEYLSKIRDVSGTLLNTLANALDISRIEAGRMKPDMVPFDLRGVFRICETIITPMAREKGVETYCHARPSVKGTLLGDPEKLRQALLNLLSNAVKFTPGGVVWLTADAVDFRGGSVSIRFEVADNGVGMSQDQMKNIFEPFAQAHDGVSRLYGGTGLGLTITKALVELMGGTLTVQSMPGKGSKFAFELTFCICDAREENPVESQPSTVRMPVFKGTVLVCEDNEMNLRVILDHLFAVGLEAVPARTGKEGVQAVRAREERGRAPFDLIFMDIHMPVMSGVAAAKSIQESGCKTPIVALTADVSVENSLEFSEYGISDFLRKPFSRVDLWRCLTRHLTPSRYVFASEKAPAKDDAGLRLRLGSDFIKEHKNTVRNLSAAIERGDYELAHRLAHTLKSAAGLLGEGGLRKIAGIVERSLKDASSAPDDELIDILAMALRDTLDKLSPPSGQERNVNRSQSPPPLDNRETAELLDKLESLLKNGDSDSLDLTDKLRLIPGTEALVENIEMYDFKPALKALAILRENL